MEINFNNIYDELHREFAYELQDRTICECGSTNVTKTDCKTHTHIGCNHCPNHWTVDIGDDIW